MCRTRICVGLLLLIPSLAAGQHQDFSDYARAYRVQVYETFHRNRAEFDFRMRMGERAVAAYHKHKSPGHRNAIMDWYRSAIESSRPGYDTPLPNFPALDYLTTNEFDQSPPSSQPQATQKIPGGKTIKDLGSLLRDKFITPEMNKESSQQVAEQSPQPEPKDAAQAEVDQVWNESEALLNTEEELLEPEGVEAATAPQVAREEVLIDESDGQEPADSYEALESWAAESSEDANVDSAANVSEENEEEALVEMSENVSPENHFETLMAESGGQPAADNQAVGIGANEPAEANVVDQEQLIESEPVFEELELVEQGELAEQPSETIEELTQFARDEIDENLNIDGAFSQPPTTPTGSGGFPGVLEANARIAGHNLTMDSLGRRVNSALAGPGVDLRKIVERLEQLANTNRQLTKMVESAPPELTNKLIRLDPVNEFTADFAARLREFVPSHGVNVLSDAERMELHKRLELMVSPKL